MTKEKHYARLRSLRMDDLDNMMGWVNDPEIIINFQNFDMHLTREQEQKFLEGILASESDKMFAVEDENGFYLGNAGIHGISSKNRLGRLALIIGKKDTHGKGYGQSALKQLLQHSFEEYQLNKVWLIVMSENVKARHIYEKIGFVVEGRLEEEYADRNGNFHDMIRMRMLRKEYEQLKTQWGRE